MGLAWKPKRSFAASGQPGLSQACRRDTQRHTTSIRPIFWPGGSSTPV